MSDDTIKNANVNTDSDSIGTPLSLCPESSAIDSNGIVSGNCDSVTPEPFTIYEFTPPITPHSLPLPCYTKQDVLSRLYQQRPRKTSSNPKWRNYTSSLESYEEAVKREYILLQRNFDYTQQYPDYHVTINFHTAMTIKDFSLIRNKAFSHLVQDGIRAYYVHEPSRRSWLHIHAMMIYSGKKETLKDSVKEAFMKAGLQYGTDFHFNISPFKGTDADYQRLCSYILKFTGRRTTPRIPTLFVTGLGIRKVGTIGQWFVKPKKVLWKEYCDEVRQRYPGQIKQVTSVASPVLCLQENPSDTSE